MIVAIVGGFVAIALAFLTAAPILALAVHGDRQAGATLAQQKRRTGLSYAVADPQHYVRLRAQHTSRRVPQVRHSRLSRFGL